MIGGRNMSRLSPSVSRAIKKIINKCENCGNKTNLHLHHIDENPENNIQSNLIVLCGDCHYGKAQTGPLSKTEQRKIIRKRSQKKKKEIQTILRKWRGRQQGKITHNEFNKFIKDIIGIY